MADAASGSQGSIQVKLVLLGEAAVGKSSVVHRFVSKGFQADEKPTIGAAFLVQKFRLEDRVLRYEIWDTAGPERFHSLAPMYYRNAQAAVVVYDITKAASLEKAKTWVNELQRQANPNIVIALAGNKLDLVSTAAAAGANLRQVPREEAATYAEEAGLLFFETSAKTGDGIVEVFTEIAQKILIGHTLASSRGGSGRPNANLSAGGQQTGVNLEEDTAKGADESHYALGLSTTIMSAPVQRATPASEPSSRVPAPLDDASESEIETLSSVSGSSGNEEATTGIEDSSVKKHARFFREGGFVTFLVENTLYRAHDYLFTTHSPYWADRLGGNKNGDASIELEDVTARDMDALLALLYNTFKGYDVKTLEDWESILRLSTKWDFHGAREAAIDMLEPLASPLQKLIMARAFDIPNWLEPALVDLCARKEPLTLAEGKKLSTEDIIFITAGREALRLKTQIAVDKNEVSAYVATHILHTETTAPASRSSPSLTLTPATSVAMQGTDAPNKADSEPAHPICVPATVQPIILSEEPSTHEVDQLVSALLKPDFDSALSMVSLESTRVFAEILEEFTSICKDADRYVPLVNAILRRASKNPSFIPIGVHLLSVLPPDIVSKRCNSNGFVVEGLRSLLRRRSRFSMPSYEDITGAATHHNNFALTLCHVDLTPSGQAPTPYFGTPSAVPLTASLYDERKANLASFYQQLVEAGMFEELVEARMLQA